MLQPRTRVEEAQKGMGQPTDFTDIVTKWGTFGIAVAVASERAWSWIMSKRYATRDELLAAIELVKDGHHRVDLVEKDIKGLPDYDKFNELATDIGELREENAGSKEWRNAVDGMLGRIHSALDRIDQRLTNRGGQM